MAILNVETAVIDHISFVIDISIVLITLLLTAVSYIYSCCAFIVCTAQWQRCNYTYLHFILYTLGFLKFFIVQEKRTKFNFTDYNLILCMHYGLNRHELYECTCEYNQCSINFMNH